MELPRNLLTKTYEKPRFYLCETDKTKICPLETINTKGSFKFNSLSDVSFEVARVYNDLMSGEKRVNPFYDKIEALRLICIDGFGYFELQAPELVGDGIKETKMCAAKSLEYTLTQKYLEDFYVNTGEIGSVEVTYAEKHSTGIIPVTLCNKSKPELSLLHLVLNKAYGWSIGYVSPALATLSRSFEVDRESVYDFLMNEVCKKFNCYIVFDTINNTINLYAESLTSKFIGDGLTNTFTISPPFAQVGTVSVNGYKTTRWRYNSTTGALVLEDVPESGAHIEVVDGALTEWETDVFVSFDNLAQEMNINYDADNIKTQLSISFGEDGDIREVNLGMPYITDLSYFYTVDWMGQDLYDAYTKYLQKCNTYKTQYTNNSQKMLDISGYIDFEENRLSLGYSVVQSVSSETIGTYYIRGGSDPNYYYTEVSLPSEYNANTTYYRLDAANLNETKVGNLFTVFKKYFNNENEDNNSGDTKVTSWKTELEKLSSDFQFMKTYTLNYLSNELSKVAENRTASTAVETAVNNFLSEMWNEIGRTPLKSLYYEPYKKVQITNMEGGWSQKDHVNYSYYYPVVLLLNSIETAVTQRDAIIKTYEQQYTKWEQENIAISNNLTMEKNFTEGQLIRLSAFLREDELQLDDIVKIDQDSIMDSFKIQQDAMESGRIELQKLCQPQLQFSMSMANIYAIPEFEPIIDQFQLGNVIKVGLRPNYIKQSRLLQVDINFDDFSDFSCEFGDLTSLRTQSDIHADLLSKAISAGKQVANSANIWNVGADRATKTDLKIQQGLLDATTRIKSIDGTQEIVIDKYGILLQKKDPITGEMDSHKTWLVNNMILMTDDNFKTSRTGLGQFYVDNQEFYGLIAEAVLSGYIESSTMVGGTINIGNGAFVVHEDGTVTMHGGGHSIDGYTTTQEMNTVQTILQNQIDNINNTKMLRVEIYTTDSMIIKNKSQTATLTCKVFSWDTDVTEQYKSRIRWIRTSNDSDGDTVWNANMSHRGCTSITINSSDITINASFHCEVDIPD